MRRILTVFACLLIPTASLFADPLGIGDPAPGLTVKEFVKGEPVKEFAKGKVYVVEFWATWCGPCRATIPHLTELQKKHKDVMFIGVSVWEEDDTQVVPFVREMGEKMDYRVAVDDKSKEKRGAMAVTWMQAAEQRGIPAAFIVNGEGKIAWIGHPARMDKPLNDIVAGKWDITKAATDYKTEVIARKKQLELMTKMRELYGRKDFDGLLKVIDDAILETPSLEKQLGMQKFTILREKKDTAALESFGKKLMTLYAEESQGLNFIAWEIVDPSKPKLDAKLLPLALEAATKADKLADGRDGAIADTLAAVQFAMGNTKEALATQERAVKMSEGLPAHIVDELKARLEEYRKAVKE